MTVVAIFLQLAYEALLGWGEVGILLNSRKHVFRLFILLNTRKCQIYKIPGQESMFCLSSPFISQLHYINTVSGCSLTNRCDVLAVC